MMTGMRTATVKMVLREKIDTWLTSISDQALRALIKDNVIITGGAITSLLQGEKPNDYDMYFKTKAAARAVANYYVGIFNSSNKFASINKYNAFVKEAVVKNCKGQEEERVLIYMQSAGIAAEGQGEYKYFESESDSTTESFFESLTKEDVGQAEDAEEEIYEAFQEKPLETAKEIKEVLSDKSKPRFRPVFLTDNAITLSDKVQLIIRFFGSVEEIHKNFDFAHAMACYDYKSDTLIVPKETYESILSRFLVYNGSLYPVATLFRMRKFMQRGWRVTAGQMLKVAFQISELDLSNPAVLKEQLIGVDYAYMHQLIRMLESREPGTQVDSVYLAKLVDEIFE